MFKPTVIQNLDCPVHTQELIIHICLEPTCLQNYLLCYQCRQTNHHQTHKIMPIKQFATTLDNLKHSQQPLHKAHTLQTQLKQSKVSLLTQLSSLTQQTLQLIDETQKLISECFQEMAEPLKAKMQGYSSTCQMIKQDSSNSNSKLEDKRHSYLVLEQRREDLEGEVRRGEGRVRVRTEAIEGKIGEVREVIVRGIEEIGRACSKLPEIKMKKKQDLAVIADNKLLNSQGQKVSKNQYQMVFSFSAYEPSNVNNPKNKNPFDQFLPKECNWSNEYKHSDMQVAGKALTRARKTTHYMTPRSCCLSSVEMSDRNFAAYDWIIKIDKIQGSVTIGMCMPEFVQGYCETNWSDIGHGHYMINNRGTAYSHTDHKVNNNGRSSSFKAGDILHFKYIPVASVLAIQTPHQQKTLIRLCVNQEQTLTKYRVCAYLGAIGDKITLL